MAITRFNQNQSIDWGIDTSSFDYIKLSQLKENEVYQLRGCFISKDNGYGRGAVFIIDGHFVNLPQRFVEVIEQIRQDPETIEQIRMCKAGFSYSKFRSRQGNTGYDITFKDMG